MDPSLPVQQSAQSSSLALVSKLRIKDLLLSSCMKTQTCHRCGRVVEYPDGTSERYANILLDKHLEDCCSMTPRASTSTPEVITSRIYPHEDERCDTDATSTLVGDSTKTSPAISTANSPLLPEDPTICNATPDPSFVESPIISKRGRAKPRKREMNEDRRRINLEEDLYTTDVRPKSVQCTECLREISLDKRWNYYDYPWRKHRRSCAMIKSAEDERSRREAVRKEAFFSESVLPILRTRSPDAEAIKVKVDEEEGCGASTTTRFAKRHRSSSEDLLLDLGRLAKRLKDCDG